MPKGLKLGQGGSSRRPVRAIEFPLICSEYAVPPHSIATREIESIQNPDTKIHIGIGSDAKAGHPKAWVLRQVGPQVMHILIIKIG